MFQGDWDMSYGPIELLVARFPGNVATGELGSAFENLVATGTIRIIDFLFVTKDAQGVVDIAEFDALGEAAFTRLDPLIAEVSGLISEEDAYYFANLLEPNSSEALLLFENVWAAQFAESFRKVNGEVILNERIPHSVIEQVLTETGAN
jgi:hypothetical protein